MSERDQPEVPAADAIRAQLQAILNSPPFLRSQRLRRFLTFLVDESLEGRGSQLKEYTIGVAVFDRRPDYDPQTDPTVRVHAGKLRDRLREYYLTDGRDAVVRIELVKGSYAPVFETTRSAAIETTGATAISPGRRRGAAVVIAAVLIAGLGAAYWSRRSPPTVLPSRADWVQLTDFPDSASQPALSPDGRMLAFLRGPNPFISNGQLFVKMLPDGEAKQLTDDPAPKGYPAFSPDSSRIAYTRASGRWETWVAPVLDGKPQRLMSDASGLTWIGEKLVMFAEWRRGAQKAIVASTEGRMEQRDVYVPPRDWGMAHFSHLSPDHAWVLVGEFDMDANTWLPCRLYPFDGNSGGKQVGPERSCREAAWAPDGKWMYFNAASGMGFHIWRQRFPDGATEQLTSGATQEHGIAMAPDGRSLVTASGVAHTSLWVHDSAGEHQISTEGSAVASLWFGNTSPFSADGRKLYYLERRASATRAPVEQRGTHWELWEANLAPERRIRLFGDFQISSFNIGADGDTLLFAAWNSKAKSEGIWIGSLEGRFPPRQVSGSVEGRFPRLSPNGELFFEVHDGNSNFLYRMNLDGTNRRKALPGPIVRHMGVSPDGNWVVVRVPAEVQSSVKAFPLSAGDPIRICDFCQAGWSVGGRSFWIRIGSFASGVEGKTFALPLRRGEVLPKLPASGIRSEAELTTLSGAHLVFDGDAAMGPNSEIYAYSRETAQRNLFRVPIPQ
jgi:Tol biopolymer transport system component